MSNKWLFCIVLGFLLIIATAMALGAAQDIKNPYPNYNINAERIFQGVIESKGHVIDGFLYFPVRTRDGLIEVQVGPEEFFRLKNFDLAVEDRVRILGVRVLAEGKYVVLAREIRSRRGMFVLRDEGGTPLWETPIWMDPEQPPMSDDVCAVGEHWRMLISD